jgi:hypothetical protein
MRFSGTTTWHNTYLATYLYGFSLAFEHNKFFGTRNMYFVFTSEYDARSHTHPIEQNILVACMYVHHHKEEHMLASPVTRTPGSVILLPSCPSSSVII